MVIDVLHFNSRGRLFEILSILCRIDNLFLKEEVFLKTRPEAKEGGGTPMPRKGEDWGATTVQQTIYYLYPGNSAKENGRIYIYTKKHCFPVKSTAEYIYPKEKSYPV